MKTSMRFDLVDLRLFLFVVEVASITHGAARAGMALASASERIRLMEESLGAPLLDRHRRGIRATPARYRADERPPVHLPSRRLPWFSARRFVADSALEGTGFELLVPPSMRTVVPSSSLSFSARLHRLRSF
jgi:hypothetical protein